MFYDMLAYVSGPKPTRLRYLQESVGKMVWLALSPIM